MCHANTAYSDQADLSISSAHQERERGGGGRER